MLPLLGNQNVKISDIMGDVLAFDPNMKDSKTCRVGTNSFKMMQTINANYSVQMAA